MRILIFVIIVSEIAGYVMIALNASASMSRYQNRRA